MLGNAFLDRKWWELLDLMHSVNGESKSEFSQYVLAVKAIRDVQKLWFKRDSLAVSL